MPLWIHFALFFGLLLVLLLGASFYVLRRAAPVLRLRRRGAWVAAALLLGSIAALVAARALGPVLGPGAGDTLFAVGATVQLGVLISACLLLPVDLLAALGGRLGRWCVARGTAPAGDPTPEPPDEAHAGDTEPEPSRDAGGRVGRRGFLRTSATGAALVVGGGSSAYGALFGRHDYRLEELAVPVAGLPPSMDGYTIAQVSDLHFGAMVGAPELEAAVTLVRRARPDLVAVTGDLVDHDVRYAATAGRLVARLAELARDGVAVIPGNHDYYAGVDEVLDAAGRAGGRVLRNAGSVVGGAGGAFALLGVDDVWASRIRTGRHPDLARALAMVPAGLPRILLCHNPSFFPEAAPHVALQLSGHTHGGQVQLGLNPARWVLPYGYVAGAYHRAGSTLYVNRGFGTAGPPARVGSPPEVTRIVLLAA